MRIESRLPEIAREMPEGKGAGVAASRQVPNTSKLKNQESQTSRFEVVSIGIQSNIKAVRKPIDATKAIEELEKFVRSQKTDVNFSIDERSQSTVIKVFQSETGKLIKQFPVEEILSMIARFQKNIGLILDKKA